jgi:hypothetical protein
VNVASPQAVGGKVLSTPYERPAPGRAAADRTGNVVTRTHELLAVARSRRRTCTGDCKGLTADQPK